MAIYDADIDSQHFKEFKPVQIPAFVPYNFADVQTYQSCSNLPKLIICDIDGTILSHHGELSDIYDETLLLLEESEESEMQVLPGVYEKFDQWSKFGHKVILVTARKESMRKSTEELLEYLAIPYDMLIMGVPRGERYLINDQKENGANTAFAVNVKRNEGLENVKI